MITQHLKDAIKELPKQGWFTIDDVSPARVARREWVFKRLQEEHILEHRVAWKNNSPEQLIKRTDYSLISFYRILPNNQ